MIGLFLTTSAAAAVSSLALLCLKCSGTLRADWLGVAVWILLLAAVSWGTLSAAQQFSASG